jgi:hypothetical protein
MYRIFLVLFSLVVFSFSAKSQAIYFAAGITPERLEKHLSVLTSDSLAGRETGTEGNMKAANYIARHFEALKIPGVVNHSYFQDIVFTADDYAEIKVRINEKDYANNWDFYSFAAYNSEMNLDLKSVLFLGYGIDDSIYSDYKHRKVKGKVLLVFNGEPVYNDSISWITNKVAPSGWSTDITKKVETAKKHGAKALLIIDGNIQKNMNAYRNVYLNGSLKSGDGLHPEQNYSNCIYISTTMAKEIIGDNFNKVVSLRKKIADTGKSEHLKIRTQLSIIQKKKIRKINSRNILAYIKGTDPKLDNELVIITAHMDHLGKKGDGIYRGADDDGSGTCAVMEIARAFAEAKSKGEGPRRSVLCMLVTGEEKGLLGSEYYSSHPVFPLENTVADVNIDMIGRIDDEHLKDPDYIYVIGSDKLSPDLHAINENMNKEYTQLKMDYRYNDENDPNRYYYRSDHYNFAKKGIPVVFYFNGTHADYHRTTDTIDKINFQLLAKRAKLAFYTAWEIANRNERLKIDKKS